MVSGLLDTYSSFKKSCQGKEGGAGVEEETGPGHKYSLNPLLHSLLSNVKRGALFEKVKLAKDVVALCSSVREKKFAPGTLSIKLA